MTAANQLILPIALERHATFDNFLTTEGSSRDHAVSLLRDSRHRYIYLSGANGSGKSHLLQAAWQMVASAVYLPLAELRNYAADQVLQNVENAPLICLDDIGSALSSGAWQRELFNLFNACADRGSRMVIAAAVAPRYLDMQLEDLRSRLQSGVTLHLPMYSDTDLRELLRFRAQHRGLDISEEVAVFLLNRLPRNATSIMAALEYLDTLSLQSQRRLTIPFVKAALDL